MDSSPTLLTGPPLPSPTAGHSWISDSSPFQPILIVLALLGTVILIYAFFFSIKCPPNSFHRLHRRSSGIGGGFTRRSTNTINMDQLVSNITYQTEENGRDSGGGGECPVCLTAFGDGEVIRQVNACQHLFHGACIDMWLYSHSSCPVCRAFIATTLSKPPVVDGEDDLRQGSPDSASLI